MKKCKVCGAEATVHVTEVNEEGQTESYHLCEEHARRLHEEYPLESGPSIQPEGETPAEIIARAKQYADTMRTLYRRVAPQTYDMLFQLNEGEFDNESPLYKRLNELQAPFGSLGAIQGSREEWIASYVQRMDRYLDRFVAFVEEHKRWPTDDESRKLYDDLFEGG